MREFKYMENLNKDLLLFSDTNTPAFTEIDFPLDWSMTRSERYGFIHVLKQIKPKISIEIGTYNGGSLQVISKYSEKVYAIDNDPTIIDRLGNKFDNVEFLIGDSKTVIPKLIKDLQAKNESIEFALIDGDHSTEGIATDIKNLLVYKPIKSLHIILHDSFNPRCRKGMKTYNYNNNKYVHYVELDFISGIFNPDDLGRQMWGGLALIILFPYERTIPLKVYQSELKLYNVVYKHSIHFLKNSLSFLKPIVRIFRK